MPDLLFLRLFVFYFIRSYSYTYLYVFLVQPFSTKVLFIFNNYFLIPSVGTYRTYYDVLCESGDLRNKDVGINCSNNMMLLIKYFIICRTPLLGRYLQSTYLYHLSK